MYVSCQNSYLRKKPGGALKTKQLPKSLLNPNPMFKPNTEANICHQHRQLPFQPNFVQVTLYLLQDLVAVDLFVLNLFCDIFLVLMYFLCGTQCLKWHLLCGTCEVASALKLICCVCGLGIPKVLMYRIFLLICLGCSIISSFYCVCITPVKTKPDSVKGLQYCSSN